MDNMVRRVALLLVLFLLGCQEGSADTRDDEWDPDTMPGTNFDFTVQISPRTEECFYQYAREGARMNIQFHVLASKDRTVSFRVRRPKGKPLKRSFMQEDGSEEFNIDESGAYEICLSNAHSMYIEKSVYLFVSVYYKEDWIQYAKDLEEQDQALNSIGNLTQTMGMLRSRVNYMLSYQNYNRWAFAKDFRMARSSSNYVQLWSFLQCVVIIGSSFFQAYFLKKMFNVQTVTPTNKPRC